MPSIRHMLYLPLRLFYRWIYAPIMGAIDDYKHRNDPPLPCQLCGKPGHRDLTPYHFALKLCALAHLKTVQI